MSASFRHPVLELLLGVLERAVDATQFKLGASSRHLFDDPLQRDGEVDRLGDAIVRSELQEFCDVRGEGLRRHHDDGKDGRRPGRANAAQRLVAVEPRHRRVEQDDVDALLLDQPQRLFAVSCFLDLEASSLKQAREQRAAVDEAVDDQHPSGRLVVDARRFLARRVRIPRMGVRPPGLLFSSRSSTSIRTGVAQG